MLARPCWSDPRVDPSPSSLNMPARDTRLRSQAHELERMGTLETEWRGREEERAARAAVRDGELARLEAAARQASPLRK